jgi:hypothetical protein
MRSNPSKSICNTVLGLMLAAAAGVHALPVAGSASGTFVNPLGDPGMVVTGVGTNNFSWGIGAPPSSLQFIGGPFSTSTETIFEFGTLNYYNGAINTGTFASSVEMDVALTLSTPLGGQTYNFNLGLNNTPNGSGTLLGDADFVSLTSSFSPTTFNAGGVDYTLEFIGFGDITGGGAVTTISEFHVYENEAASAKLLGRITANIPPAVPEPTSLTLMGLGALAVGLVSRKKLRA